jgi:hypothetical protein
VAKVNVMYPFSLACLKENHEIFQENVSEARFELWALLIWGS